MSLPNPMSGGTGATGATGAAGPGVPTGGTAGQTLAKINSTDYNTQWITPSAGGGASNLLNFILAADISFATGTIAANTWTDIITQQTFTVASTSSEVLIAASGSMEAGGAANNFAMRLVIDKGAGGVINRAISGFPAISGGFINPLAGVGTQRFTGLSVGAHTLDLQIYCYNGTGELYCRAASLAFEFFSLMVESWG